MNFLKYFLFVVCLIAILPIQAQDNFDPSFLDQELSKALDSFKVAGFGVAVVKKDEIIYSRGFGYRDLENKIEADENTLFAIGSCTKAFTTSILGMLQEKGEIDFDESPRKYIPELEFYNDNLNANVIIRDIIAHRTGIPRHDFSWYLFPTDSDEEMIERMKHHENFTGLRQQWYYNNFMYFLQGQIAERITGKSWGENIKSRIFEPLKMERSQVTLKPVLEMENVSNPYGLDANFEIEKVDHYEIESMAPAGSIYSSVNEMANWVKCWINNGKFEDEQIIPSSFRSQAMSSHMVVRGGLPGEQNPDLHFANYGYAWFMSSYRGHYRVEHGGNIDGFSASTSFLPSDSIGVIVLVNQNGSAANGAIRNVVYDHLLGLEYRDWIGNIKKDMDKNIAAAKEASANIDDGKAENTKPSQKLKNYVGVYENPGYGAFEVVLSNDSLYAQFPREKIHLAHYHYDVFQPFMIEDGVVDTNAIGILFQFYSNTQGEINRVESQIEPTVDPISFNRKIVEVEIAKDALSAYVGDYELAGNVGKIYTKDDVEGLFLLVPGQPEYELISMGDHKFALKDIDGFSVVFEDEVDGIFMSVKFHQPNGVFKATRKKE